MDFYFNGKPVGCLVGPDCPAVPGRYRFEPYRGEGHSQFSRALHNGAAQCSLAPPGHAARLLIITAEEFIEAIPDCQWFVQIAKVRPVSRLPIRLVAAWQRWRNILGRLRCLGG